MRNSSKSGKMRIPGIPEVEDAKERLEKLRAKS